jgi:hypothetical protein
LPDVVLYLQQEEEVLVSRTLGRGHARIAGSTPDNIVHFIKQAVNVFNEMINIPEIQERLLIVDGSTKIYCKSGDLFDLDYQRVTELVRYGR